MFLAVATIAIWSTTRGLGSFAGSTATSDLIELDVFLAVVGIPSFVLATITEERIRALVALRDMISAIGSFSSAIRSPCGSTTT